MQSSRLRIEVDDAVVRLVRNAQAQDDTKADSEAFCS